MNVLRVEKLSLAVRREEKRVVTMLLELVLKFLEDEDVRHFIGTSVEILFDFLKGNLSSSKSEQLVRLVKKIFKVTGKLAVTTVLSAKVSLEYGKRWLRAEMYRVGELLKEFYEKSANLDQVDGRNEDCDEVVTDCPSPYVKFCTIKSKASVYGTVISATCLGGVVNSVILYSSSE